MAAHSRGDVRLALAIAMLESQQRPKSPSLQSINPATNENDGSKHHSSNKYKRKIKELKAQSHEMQLQIDKLRSEILESLVPNVLCPCFSSSSSSSSIWPQLAQSKLNLIKDDVDRFFDCVHLLNKRRRLQISQANFDDDRAAKLAAQCIVDLVADARSQQLLSVWLHQAVDFVKDFESKTSKGIALDAIAKLIAKLVSYTTNPGFDSRPSAQRVLLQLAELPLLGQKLLVRATKELVLVAEALLHCDPFSAVAQLLENAYFLLDLVETIVAGQLSSWVNSGCIDKQLIDEFVNDFFCVKSIASAGGQMSVLLLVYAERICAQIVRQLDGVHEQLLNKPMERFVEDTAV